MPKVSRGVERNHHKTQLVKRNLSSSKRLDGLAIAVWARQKGSGRVADKSHRSWLARALQTQHLWPKHLWSQEKTSQQSGNGQRQGKSCLASTLPRPAPSMWHRQVVHLGAAPKWPHYTWGSPFTELTCSIGHLIWGNRTGSDNQHLHVPFDFCLSSSFFRRLAITQAWRMLTLA